MVVADGGRHRAPRLRLVLLLRLRGALLRHLLPRIRVWTLLSCTLCFLCAFNLDSRPIYAATFPSLIYAYGHFIVEYLVYHTVGAANLAGLGVFAVTAIIWMLLQWNSHKPRVPKQP